MIASSIHYNPLHVWIWTTAFSINFKESFIPSYIPIFQITLTLQNDCVGSRGGHNDILDWWAITFDSGEWGFACD